LFYSDKSFDTIDHLLHKFNFRETNALLVGNIPLTPWACRSVFTCTASGLHTKTLSEVFELMRSECIGKEWQQDHCRCTEPSP